jgi:hypothetical protein
MFNLANHPSCFILSLYKLIEVFWSNSSLCFLGMQIIYIDELNYM